MDGMTNVKLENTAIDIGAHDAPMALAAGIAYLGNRGVKLSRASLYRWHADSLAAGGPALIHQPSGFKGRTYIVPAEIETWIRNRCSAPAPADRVRS